MNSELFICASTDFGVCSIGAAALFATGCDSICFGDSTGLDGGEGVTVLEGVSTFTGLVGTRFDFLGITTSLLDDLTELDEMDIDEKRDTFFNEEDT